MDTANDVLGKVLGSSTSTSPSSTKADNEAKQSSSEAETVIFETAKLQVNILNKSESSGRSQLQSCSQLDRLLPVTSVVRLSGEHRS